MNILITTEKCMICGKPLSDKENNIKGHLIPKMLKPKDNIMTFFHKECEDRLNGLYVHTQRAPQSKKIINILKNTIVSLTNKLEELKDE